MLSCSAMSDFFNDLHVACQAPLPTESSRQEYWSGLPFPTPGNLPNPDPRLLHLPHWQPDSLPPCHAGRRQTNEWQTGTGSKRGEWQQPVFEELKADVTELIPACIMPGGGPEERAGGSSFPQLARCPEKLQEGYKGTFSSLTHSGCTRNPRTWSTSNTRYVLSFPHTGNSTVIIWPYSQGLLTIFLEGCKAWPGRALSSRGPPVTYPYDYSPVNPTK